MNATIPISGGAPSDAVVLIHGMFATTRSMRKAASYLQAQGYFVINWGYPTFWRTIETHACSMLPVLEELEKHADIRSVSFFTHSLGGILARYALELGRFRKAKRLVMLAPPNSGSHLTNLPLGPFARCIPAIAQLSPSADGLPNQLKPLLGIEIGIIAASSDFIVRLDNTTLPYQRDHRVVCSNHFQLPYLDEVLDLAGRFLAGGSFEVEPHIRAAGRATAA